MSARRIKAIAAAAVALSIGTLITACGSNDDTPVVQSTWQITNVYVDEQHPSVLPDSIAGKATRFMPSLNAVISMTSAAA